MLNLWKVYILENQSIDADLIILYDKLHYTLQSKIFLENKSDLPDKLPYYIILFFDNPYYIILLTQVMTKKEVIMFSESNRQEFCRLGTAQGNRDDSVAKTLKDKHWLQ